MFFFRGGGVFDISSSHFFVLIFAAGAEFLSLSSNSERVIKYSSSAAAPRGEARLEPENGALRGERTSR